jgi:hypothetical protein
VFDPTYVPTGRNTKKNPYYKKGNHTRQPKGIGSKTLFSGAPEIPVAPALVSAAVVSGITTVGQTLTATNGVWSGTTPITYERRWQRFMAAWETIAGATASTYVLQAGDVGAANMLVQTRATNVAGTSAWTNSNTVGPVAALPVAPANTVIPALSGTAQVGQSLTATTGTWTGTAPITYEYTWQSSPSGTGSWAIISGATAATYTAVIGDLGRYIRSRVRGTNVAGVSGWANSNVSAAVIAAGGALKPGTLTNPPFGLIPWFGAPGDIDHSPWINVLKGAMEPQTSGVASMTFAQMIAAGHMTADGTVNSIPPGADNILISALLNRTAASGAGGRYRLFYTGPIGNIWVFGNTANVDESVAGQIDFDFTANGASNVSLLVVGAPSPIKVVALVHHDNLAAYAAGDVFEPLWLDKIRNSRVIRFVDWSGVDSYNGAGTWATRYTPDRITYLGGEGIPLEVMCDLCDEIGADPWFTLISNADDNYCTQAAALIRSRLEPHRHVYVELSNKIWDSSNYRTADYFRNLAVAWFSDNSVEACMEAYGGRSSQVFQIFQAEFSGANAGRLKTVLQGWTPLPNFIHFMANAPRWVALGGGRVAPKTVATHYAMHANLDGGLRYDWIEGSVATIQGWFDTLNEQERIEKFALAIRGNTEGITGGYTVAGNITAYQATKAEMTAGGFTMTPIMYEGGSHLCVPYSMNGNSTWVDFYRTFLRSPDYADVFSDMIDAWYAEFPGPESIFVRRCDARPPDINQTEGLWWHLNDTASLQSGVWDTQQNTRTGATGRGANDFVGAYDLA